MIWFPFSVEGTICVVDIESVHLVVSASTLSFALLDDDDVDDDDEISWGEGTTISSWETIDFNNLLRIIGRAPRTEMGDDGVLWPSLSWECRDTSFVTFRCSSTSRWMLCRRRSLLSLFIQVVDARCNASKSLFSTLSLSVGNIDNEVMVVIVALPVNKHA